MYDQHLISVVVPAHNEAGNVETVIETIPTYVDRTYVIDDHSSDDTWEEITRTAEKVNKSRTSLDGGTQVPKQDGDRFGASQSDVVVPIQHDHNKGVGGAITTGYERARADGMDIAVVMAGDGQMDPDILPRIIEPVVSGRAEYSKGDRLGSKELVKEMPAWRLFGNLLLTLLTRCASGYWEMSDPQNGYTALDLDVFDEISSKELHQEYGFLNNLLVRLNTVNARIADVPMQAKYGEEQSGIRYSRFTPKLSWLLARDFLGRMRTSFHEEGHLLPAALILGVLCLLLSLLLTAQRATLGDASDDERTGPAFVIGVLLTVLSLAADRHRNAGLVEKVNIDNGAA